MTREDVKKIFPDATDDQITSFLNQSNSDVAKEKAKNQKLKEDAEKAKALETELEELKQQNMTDAEKAELERQKEKAANEKRISDLENALATSQKRALVSEIASIFAKAGLSETTYASAIEAFSLMPVESKPEEMAKSFVNGVSEENKAALDNAKSEWEKSVLDNTPNPGGGNPDKGQKKDDNDSPAAKYAKAYSARMNPKTEPADDNAPVNF